ncbi:MULTISPECIES: hypothetical protein [unclassified Curtobacterium]|uniref:hypothetical protein n=1 Tax=unclassified Curtobacterium TaxID=257496 RepID=UPI000DA9EF30|nr:MULTISPECIES: hypothetical protein [unclassified Curtobacterium]PZE76609.1 hypothetical protein DEI82_05445 [Curtobacterium sp. MCBD17_019]WIE55677.1 hypothetical protein DEI88_005615 [Curtobacterium sp. MCBD17_003]
MTYASERQARATPPTLVNAAFWLFMLAVLAQIVSLIVSISTFGTAEDEAKRRVASTSSNLSESTVHAALVAGLVIAIVIGVLSIIAFALFDVFMRRGANWARIVLLILTILSVFTILGGHGINAVGEVAAIVATILMYLRPSSAYFAAVKARKTGAQPLGY